jgi:hypothetical protein
MAAEFDMPGTSLYGSSKAALVLLTKVWAAEFGPSGVRVNAVNPGPTRTEGTAVLGEAIDEFAALAPAGRPASPDEIAAGSPIWLRMTPASFTARSSLSTAAARRPDEYQDRCQRPDAVRRRDRQAAARKSHDACRTSSDRRRWTVPAGAVGPDEHPRRRACGWAADRLVPGKDGRWYRGDAPRAVSVP